jgi:DOPA 4,5-dioxygenase
VLVHPLTREEREDHDSRKAWIGESWPVLLEVLPDVLNDVPLQYPSLGESFGSSQRVEKGSRYY